MPPTNQEPPQITAGSSHQNNLAFITAASFQATESLHLSERDVTSPNRRRSIGVPDQDKPAFITRRRRAHSVVTGDHLSPLARARRSLVPRKSILKAPLINPSTNDSQQNPVQTSFTPDATQSIDLTTEFQSQQDNTTRRSLGRRVSFAAHCTVRVFNKPSSNNPNGVDSPATSTDRREEPQINDENAYPGARPNGRRSSVRFSMGPSAEDMDLTSVGPVHFAAQDDLDESAIMDEDLEGGSLDDMDGTDVIDNALKRRRSSVAAGLSTHSADDNDMSITDDGYPSDDMERSREQDMEFTIPINRPLRPAEQDEAWLALRRMTHSGSENAYEQEAETSDQSISFNYDTREDSYQDGPSHDMDDAEHTINISKVLGWPSQTGNDSQMSTGDESIMEESDVYGLPAPESRSTPQPSTSTEPRHEQGENPPSRPSSFQTPSTSPSSHSQGTNGEAAQSVFPLPDSRPFTFTAPRPNETRTASPSKIPIFKPSFTAAFAPPVAKPTPRKVTAHASPSKIPSPNKRPRQVDDDGSTGEANMSIDVPSPAKRQAMANKWPGSKNTPTDAASHSMPKPLSPSKKAPFQRASSTTSLRRPSGYFSRRKSLAIGATSQPGNDTVSNSSRVSTGAKAGLGFRRASVGSGSADALQQFDKTSLPAQGVTTVSHSTMQQRNESTTTNQPVLSARADGPHVQPDSHASSPSQTHTGMQFNTSGASSTPPDIEKPPEPVVSVDLANIFQSTADEDAEAVVNTDSAGHLGPEEDAGHLRGAFNDGNPQEISSVSIEQFFAMSGIRFMDELTAPRRSIYPSHHHPSRQAREEKDIALAEYFSAMAIDVPQLELYTRVARDLEAWMEQSRTVYVQAEEEAAKMTPELFVEYCRADEEGQAELMHQLNLIRTNVRGQAKSDWYDWKLQWVESLRETGDKAFNVLEEDAKMLESIRARADEVVPLLERVYENVMRELELEKAEVAEIEASDQDYLNELKNTISEQNIEVEALQAELVDGKSRLGRLEERLEEIDSQKQEASSAIESARRTLLIQRSSTRAEVSKLKEELEAFENLHMFRATHISPDLFQYIYNSQFCVTTPCQNYMPIVTQVKITRVKELRTRYKDDFPKLSDFFLDMAKRQIIEGENLSMAQMVQRLGDYWSSCTEIRSQLRFLKFKYPVDIEIIRPVNGEGLPHFKTHATILFLDVKAKATVSFIFSSATFCFWPMALDSLDCEVKVAYGPIDRSTILKRVVDRLSQASPADNHACLLDACIEAQETYIK
ncbi:hypothetical protein APHAL10511_006476 [Amanita phalloides]|nr:hypothetical protein APHAL10511_006476 [Amanita phalloides]